MYTTGCAKTTACTWVVAAAAAAAAAAAVGPISTAVFAAATSSSLRGVVPVLPSAQQQQSVHIRHPVSIDLLVKVLPDDTSRDPRSSECVNVREYKGTEENEGTISQSSNYK